MAKVKISDKESAGKLEFKVGQAEVANKALQIRAAVCAHRAAAASTPDAEGVHGRPEVLLDPMFYPPHDQRTETSGYRAVHHELTVVKDLPCLVCGVRHSTLDKKDQNPYGAVAMETHHHIVEWALANAIDPGLFNRALLPNLKEKHPGKSEYDKPEFTEQDVRDWVDHSPDNLWVLCDVHHRHKWVGIHQLSYPMWAPQDLLKQTFRDEVAAAVSEWERSHPAKGTSA
jgi:hypothetical protein